jgi:hypothetical protein
MNVKIAIKSKICVKVNSLIDLAKINVYILCSNYNRGCWIQSHMKCGL